MILRVKRSARDRHRAVLFGREIVQRDRGMRGGIGALDSHVAAARRLQVADRRRDRVERVQRLAELVERQRLHVPLDVRGRLRRIALRERAELRRRHRERPGAEQRVLERHRGLAEPGARAPIQRDGVVDLVDRADLQVVVQIRADAGRVAHDADAVLAAAARRGRCPRAAGSAASRSTPAASSTSRRARKACAARAAVERTATPTARSAPSRVSVEHALDERAGAHREIRRGSARAAERPCVALQRRPRRWFIWKYALPKLSPRLNSAIFGMPHSCRRVAPRVENLPAHAPLLDAQLAARAVQLVRAVLVVLGALEHRQHVVPRPAAQPERGPVVVVGLSGRACRSSR